MINLGDKVKDTVTGFTGIAVARTEWLHGCTRISIQPDKLGKDGQPQELQSFDEPQVVLIKAKKVKRMTDTGGPKPTMKQKETV